MLLSSPILAQTESWASDLAWTEINNGHGPVEKDQSNGEQLAGDGVAQSIEGIGFTKGFGAHSFSQIDVPLNGQWRAFTSFIGVDDEVPDGSIVFAVWLDGTERYRSGVVYSYSPPESINVDVTGGNLLSLIIEDAGDGIAYDHGDWAGAKVSTVPLLQFRITTSATNGTIGLSPSRYAYDSGNVVAVTANPDPGYRFLRWTGDITSGGRVGFITMNANKSIVAEFELIPTFTLTTTTINGNIVLNPPGGQYQEGVWVSLTATINPGFAFTGWGGALSGMTLTQSLQMDSNKSVSAFFVSSDTTWISDLAWTEVTNGHGPVEKDMSNGEQGMGDGGTLTLRGATYAKGLGTHSYSRIDVPVGGVYEWFDADIGIDDEVGLQAGAAPAVVFVVQLDGVEIYRSTTLGLNDAAVRIHLAVAGGQVLNLIIEEASGGNAWDHADWAGARVYRPAPTPIRLSGTPPENGVEILSRNNGFTIRASAGVRYSVFDYSGKAVKQGRTLIDNETIRLTGGKKGVYLVKIDRTKQSWVKRLVLQ